MKSLTSRKWRGIVSLVWACGGFLALRLGCFQFVSGPVGLLIFLGVWWGVALVLAVSGMRSRSLPGVLGGLATADLFLWLLSFSVLPNRRGDPAPVITALTQIASFKTALDSFQIDNGFYPPGTNGLLDLVVRPVGATDWRGPYLDCIPVDPWGREYVYECPGKHSAAGHPYDLFSRGPPQDHHPVANWMPPDTGSKHPK